MSITEIYSTKRKAASRVEMRMNKVKASILAKIAEDVKTSVPIKRTDTMLDENGEMILYTVDFCGLVTHEGDGLLRCLLCQRVLYADRDKVSRYAASKEPVTLTDAERNVIYKNIVMAGYCDRKGQEGNA